MNPLQRALNQFFQTIKRGVKRFPFTFGATLAAVVISSWLVIDQTLKNPSELPVLLVYATWFFAVASATIELSRLITPNNRRVVAALEAIALALSVGWYLLIRTGHQPFYYAYMFVMFALAFSAFFIIMSHPDRERIAAHFVKSIVLAGAICGIIVAGLMLCVSAVHGLLFKIPHFYEVLSIIAIIGAGFVFTNTLLALLPEKDEEIVVPKVVKTLSFYVAFPLFIALIVVLCLYLVKILITQKIPSNQINLYVSLASFAFIFFSFVLTAFKSRAVELFEKYMGIIMLPLIAMQVYVVNIRLSAYGYTSLRWVSVVCIFLSICFAISTFIKRGAFKRYVAVVAALCMLLLAYGPLSALNVPARSQARHLKALLEQNNIWKDGQIVANPNATQKAQTKISSSYKVVLAGEPIPSWVPVPEKNTKQIVSLTGNPPWTYEAEEKTFENAFGFPLNSSNFSQDDGAAFVLDGSQDVKVVPLEPYTQMYPISEYRYKEDSDTKEMTVLSYGGKTYDIKAQLHAITNPKDTNQLRIQLDDSTLLIISSVMYEEDKSGDPISLTLEGYLLTR